MGEHDLVFGKTWKKLTVDNSRSYQRVGIRERLKQTSLHDFVGTYCTIGNGICGRHALNFKMRTSGVD